MFFPRYPNHCNVCPLTISSDLSNKKIIHFCVYSSIRKVKCPTGIRIVNKSFTKQIALCILDGSIYKLLLLQIIERTWRRPFKDRGNNDLQYAINFLTRDESNTNSRCSSYQRTPIYELNS